MGGGSGTKSKKIEWPQSGILQIMRSVGGTERKLPGSQEFCLNGAWGGWVHRNLREEGWVLGCGEGGRMTAY